MHAEQIVRVEHKVAGGGAFRPVAPTHEECEADLQGYTRPLERVHAGSLHGSGVVEGMSVVATIGSATVRVSPGVAIDPQGRHVVLAAGGSAELSSSPDDTSQLAVLTADGVEVPTAGLSGVCAVTVQWRETVDKAPSPGAPPPFRTRHTPWLLVMPLPLDATQVQRMVLGTVTLDPAGIVVSDGASVGDRHGPATPVASLRVSTPHRTATSTDVVVADRTAGQLSARVDGGLLLEVADPTGALQVGAADGTLSLVDVTADRVLLHGADDTRRIELDPTGSTVSAGTLRLGGPSSAVSLASGSAVGVLGVTADRVAVSTSGGTERISLDAATATVTTGTLRLGSTANLAPGPSGSVVAVSATGGPVQLGVGTAAPRNALGLRGMSVSEELLSFEDAGGVTRWHVNQLLNGQRGLNFVETGRADGRLYLQAGGNVGIGTVTPRFTLDVNGTVCAQQFCNPSDARLKSDVTPLGTVLDLLADVQGVSYLPVNDATEHPAHRQIGVLAHEVEDAFPELVVQIGDTGTGAVDYMGLTAVLVQAVGELRARNATLSDRVGALELQLAGDGHRE
jgi:hypothetical protein